VPYLSGKDNAFEKAIDRGAMSYRSAPLTSLAELIKRYIRSPSAAILRALSFTYDAWMTEHPLEFANRGAPIQSAFESELLEEYRKFGIPCDDDFAPDLGSDLPAAPAVAVNRWTTYAKTGAKAGMSTASVGVSAAGTVTHQGMTTLALGGAAALSATGVGLVAAGAALTVATSVLALKSAWKTKKHKDALIEIFERRNKAPFNDAAFCTMIPSAHGPVAKTRAAYIQHDMIANLVLPYVIRKKDAKITHKLTTAVPMVGSSLETARAVLKKGYKFANGTLGVHRQNACGWLAWHLISCDCLLVQAIVAELFSASEMEWLKLQEYDAVVGALGPKLKST
jgi:hypothetical protein